MSSNQGLWAIRQGDWKLLLGQGGGFGWGGKKDPNEPAGQLYNQAEDLGERTNLYTRHPEKVAELELKALLERIQTTRASRGEEVERGLIRPQSEISSIDLVN